MNRSEVINYLIDKGSFSSYLEIRTQRADNTFKDVICDSKVLVDPDQRLDADHKMVSDAFFIKNKEKFDLILIDGTPTKNQSLRDYRNALKYIKKGGVIVLSGVLPTSKQARDKWQGHAYRTAIIASCEFKVRTIDVDGGLCVVFTGESTNREIRTSGHDINKLKKVLNTVDKLEDLAHSDEEALEVAKEIEAEEEKTYNAVVKIGFEDMSDDEVKAEYKEKTGKKRVNASVTREDMINELSK